MPPTADGETLRRERLAARLCLVWAVIIATAEWLGAFSGLNNLFWDHWQQRPALVAESDHDFALVAIDHIPPDRPWPWSRLNYAILLDSIVSTSPHSVVFDMLLNDRDTQYTAFDNSFASKVGMFPRTAFAAAVLVRDSVQPLPANASILPTSTAFTHLPRFGEVLWPLDTFAGGARVGIRNLLPEESGRLRRIPLIFRVGSKIIPSLTLQAVLLRYNADPSQILVLPGEAIVIKNRSGALLQRIPIDSEGRLWLRFRAAQPKPWNMAFDDVPLAAVESANGDVASRARLEDLRRRQLWVARTDVDTVQTPVGPMAPVEVQMAAARAILHNDFIVVCPGAAILAIYILLGVFAGGMAARHGLLPIALLGIVVSLTAVEMGGILFQTLNLALPLGSFLALIGGIVFMSFTARHWSSDGGIQLDLGI